MSPKFLIGDLVIHRLSTLQTFEHTYNQSKDFPSGIGVIIDHSEDDYFVVWDGLIYKVRAVYLRRLDE
tara:strand:+ start:253 stop:456 length:204 start_codon:yes stop_codon:yes gene_type:complete